MALPDTGNPISLQQVNVELGLTATATINMGASNVRTLFDDASGAISMSDGYGKSNNVAVTASAASSANLETLFDNATSGSWADSIAKVYDIGAISMGILTVPTGMGGTLEINIASGGTVRGVGGAAGSAGSGGSGNGSVGSAGGAGAAGGTAMSVSSTGVTVNVVGHLQGGGGGGGGGGARGG